MLTHSTTAEKRRRNWDFPNFSLLPRVFTSATSTLLLYFLVLSKLMSKLQSYMYIRFDPVIGLEAKKKKSYFAVSQFGSDET